MESGAAVALPRKGASGQLDVGHPARLRVMIVALNYAPELVGCAKYTSELAEDLVARGHEVQVVTAPPYYPAWSIAPGYSGARWHRENLQSLRVEMVLNRRRSAR